MKKILTYFFLITSCLSWLIFFTLGLIFFYPNQSLQAINSALPSNYDFEYSEVINKGSILNPILEFSNLTVQTNDVQVYSAKKSIYGFILSPALMIGEITVNHLYVEEANILLPDNSDPTISKFKISLDTNITLSFKNTFLTFMGSKLLMNGELNSLLPGSANGQITMNHQGKVSNISISSDGEISNFLINLNQLNWLQYLPSNNLSSSKTVNFGVNLIGSWTGNGSAIRGSINLEESSFDSYILKKNHGSFSYQSTDEFAILALNNFLHPFIDEQFPIKFNLSKKTIAISDFFLSQEVLELKEPRFSNLAIKDMVVVLKDGAIKYSGKIADLDLLNVYFDELSNIQGQFSGKDNKIKFEITPSQSFIKNKNSEQHSVQIVGKGGLNDSSFYLDSRIEELASSISLKLDLPINNIKPLSIKLSGQNISKKMILASLPKTLASTSMFIDQNIELSFSNNIFLDYRGATKILDSNLLLKLSLHSSKFDLNTSLDVSFEKGLIEIDNDNLYLYLLPGNVNEISFKDLYGNLQFSNQNLQYVSQHNVLSDEIATLLNSNLSFADSLNVQALSKGFFNIVSKKQYNSLSIKTDSFSVPVYKSNTLDLHNGQIFALEFNKVFGRFPAEFLSEETMIFLRGQNLLAKYELDFLLQTPLRTEKLIPDLSILKVSGEGVFSAVLSVVKNSPPVLNIFSDLKGVEFESKLSFLEKSKFKVMPTNFEISNLSEPGIFIKNSLLEIKLNSFLSPMGYVVIGKEIPEQYHFIKQAKGLNLYVGLDTIATNTLTSMSQVATTDQTFVLNNFLFDIGNLEIFNNQFKKIHGSLSLQDQTLKGKINSDKFNGNFEKDNSGFIKIQLEDTHLDDISFLKPQSDSFSKRVLNARLIVKNSSVRELKIDFLDLYLQQNKNLFTVNNIDMSSNLMSISSLSNKSKAYFSVDNKNDIYKLRGNYLVKDSLKIPFIKNLSNFSYFNGDINLQWQDLKRLQDIEGTLDFILKDLVVTNKTTNSVALNLLGVLNLKNILGKLANLDLTIDEFTSTQLNRVEGEIVFSKLKARLAAPLFIETNAAKMKWIGQINKNSTGELSELDLSLDLRVRIGENIPWYAAVLGGIPAVAGSAIISEIFETNINDLSNYQFEVSGSLNAPKINRMN